MRIPKGKSPVRADKTARQILKTIAAKQKKLVKRVAANHNFWLVLIYRRAL
jgi:hypothetical protein